MFKHIANDGKADRMIIATEMLNHMTANITMNIEVLNKRRFNDNYIFKIQRDLHSRNLHKQKMKSVFQELEEVVCCPDNIMYMIENGYFSDNVTIEGGKAVFSV